VAPEPPTLPGLCHLLGHSSQPHLCSEQSHECEGVLAISSRRRNPEQCHRTNPHGGRSSPGHTALAKHSKSLIAGYLHLLSLSAPSREVVLCYKQRGASGFIVIVHLSGSSRASPGLLPACLLSCLIPYGSKPARPPTRWDEAGLWQ
jgi:hypothetical protein